MKVRSNAARDDLVLQRSAVADRGERERQLREPGDVLLDVLRLVLELEHEKPAQPGAVLAARHLGRVEHLQRDACALIDEPGDTRRGSARPCESP